MSTLIAEADLTIAGGVFRTKIYQLPTANRFTISVDGLDHINGTGRTVDDAIVDVVYEIEAYLEALTKPKH